MLSASMGRDSYLPMSIEGIIVNGVVAVRVSGVSVVSVSGVSVVSVSVVSEGSAVRVSGVNAVSEGSTVRVTYDHLGGGLVVKGGKLEGFAMAGADRKWVWAEAKVDGNDVLLSSPRRKSRSPNSCATTT